MKKQSWIWIVLATSLTAEMPLRADIPQAWYTLGGRRSDVHWAARWIWTDGPRSPRNLYLCVRKDFQTSRTNEPARLHVSADSRYRLYLNGQWLGDGPARSFFWAQQFDTYDVTGLLKPGRNVLALLVSHYGEGTFQYHPSGQAGVLVQLETKRDGTWVPIVVSDETWQVQVHAGYLRPTVRISCQMPFEEIVDGRLFPGDWMQPDGALSSPAPAKVIGPVGSGPWRTMVARSVPFLTREPVPPVRLFRTQLTRFPNLHTGFTARPYLLAGYFMQNTKPLAGFAATIIESPVDQTITFFTGSPFYEPPVVAGQVAWPGKPVPLKKGSNLCLIPFQPTLHHRFDRSYPAFVDHPVRLRGVFNDRTAWTIFGPFEHYDKKFHDDIQKVTTVKELEPYRDKAQTVRPEDILTHGSPFDDCAFARRVEGRVRIDNVEGLFGNENEVTTIWPAENGNPELFLDFGRELVGPIELDVEAPAGTVMSFCFVEEIEDGRRIHYTFDNQNGFRFVTGGGRERFTSFLRRGYRYAKLIISDMTGPVRIRSIRTLFATHPTGRNGAFRCSDALLNEIWRVGRHTLRCCSEDTFTDCPTYEQTFWVGDARNEAMIDYAAFGHLALTRRCAELPILSLYRQPITESQVPSAWDNLLTAWWLLWIQMVEEHYEFSGNRSYLAGVYPGVKLSLDNARKQFIDGRGLLSIDAWNLFDWAPIDSVHKTVTHNQMFLVEALRRAAFMARELGKTDDARELDEWRQRLIADINKYLFNEDRGAYVDSLHEDGKQSPSVSQQVNALAIAYDVAPPDRLDRIEKLLIDPPENVVTVGSPFALFYVLEALAKQNRHAKLLEIIRDRWGEMIAHGATTFWETFPGRGKEWWTRSYCHAWSAAPTYFLTRYQLGGWWAEPGYRLARIAPVPLDLKWAIGRVPTLHGPIEIAWENTDETFVIEVALPPKVAGIVELPGPAKNYTELKVKGLTPHREQGRWRIPMAAGTAVKIEAAKKKPVN